MKKLSSLLILSLFIFLLIGIPTAEAVVNITRPYTNETFTTTLNLPLNYTTSLGVSCYYNITDLTHNYTLRTDSGCNVNTTFSVLYGNNVRYNITVVELDIGLLQVGANSVLMTVDRGNEIGLSNFGFAVLLGLVMLASFFGASSFAVKDTHFGLKSGLWLLSAVFILFTVQYSIVFVDEYIKQPSLLSLLVNFFYVVSLVVVFVIGYLMIQFIRFTIKYWEQKKFKGQPDYDDLEMMK